VKQTHTAATQRESSSANKKKLMKNNNLIEAPLQHNFPQESSAPRRPRFVREYVIRIEGDPTDAPIGSGSQASEEAILTSLHAAAFMADEVERYWQTSLQNRTVKVSCKKDQDGGK
jgi:hypothetical protein